MKKKRIIISLVAIIIVVVAGICTFFALSKNKDSEDYVKAEEWMMMLCEHTGCDMFELPDGYDKDDKADSRLICITAFRTIDDHKLKRIVEDKDLFSDDDLYDLAVSYNLIENKKTGYTPEDCAIILKRYNEIYFDEIWLDDFCEVDYKEDTRVLDSVVVSSHNDDYTYIDFEGNINAAVGEVIVYEDEKGCKRTGKVESIDDAGGYHLVEPEIEEVLYSFDFSDIREVTYDDVLADNKAYEVASISKPLMVGNAGKYSKSTANQNKLLTYDPDEQMGFSFKISVEDNDYFDGNYLGIEMENKATGETVSYLSNIKLDENAFGSLTIDLSNIRVSSDMTYFTFGKGEKYAEYRLKMDTSITGSIGLEKEIDIPLFETTIPFEYGLVCIDLGVYLNISAEGEVAITYSMPTNICIRHDKTGGLRMIEESDVSPSIETKMDAEAMLALKAGADLRMFFFWDLLGVDVKAGALAEGEEIQRDNGMTCRDMKVSFPVVKAGGYIDGLFSKLEAEFTIYEGSPLYSTHYEEVPKIRKGVVPECSYGNDELFAQYNGEAETEKPDNPESSDFSMIYGHDLYSEFEIPKISSEEIHNGDENNEAGIWDYKYDVKDVGNGYEVVGTLYVNNRISCDRYRSFIDSAQEGDTLTYLGRTYTLESYTVNDMGRGTCKLLGDDGNIYTISNDLSPEFDNMGNNYFTIYKEGDDTIVIENVRLFISYEIAGRTEIPYLIDAGNQPYQTRYGIKLDEAGNVIDVVIWH